MGVSEESMFVCSTKGVDRIVGFIKRKLEIMYTEKELVRIAKRENNTKRNYLVVNCLQGKHIPVEPRECLHMFDELAAVVAKEYEGEMLLLIGFAETATAIGARLAVDMGCYYMQTTREQTAGMEYLYFTEAHSHATEQKLIKTDLDRIIGDIGRIVFVEDEVTTGNTILNIVELIQQAYSRKLAFSVASLLNGMDAEAETRYRERGIRLHYLVKTDHSRYPEMAEEYRGDGMYHKYTDSNPAICSVPFPVYQAAGYRDGRRLLKGADYEEACRSLAEQICQWVSFTEGECVLVLGTEEFMYPAIYTASVIADAGCLVRCHATTRSPIAVSTEVEYPLHERYELHSFYEEERRTFLYDLEKYDKVLILTDACGASDRGIHDLCCNLAECGNTDIRVVRWCE